MNSDSLLQSLFRGRLLAASAATAAAGVSASTLVTGNVDEWTAALNAILMLISALAAIISKLREIKGAS
jgi:hypothetical protein